MQFDAAVMKEMEFFFNILIVGNKYKCYQIHARHLKWGYSTSGVSMLATTIW